MNDYTEDPKLTAYALGELHGAEKAEVEARLATDETARRYVEEVRSLGDLLTTELRKESGAGLTSVQKQSIEQRAQEKPQRGRVFTLRRIVSLAACLAIIGILSAMLLPALGESREFARRKSSASDLGQHVRADTSYDNRSHFRDAYPSPHVPSGSEQNAVVASTPMRPKDESAAYGRLSEQKSLEIAAAPVSEVRSRGEFLNRNATADESMILWDGRGGGGDMLPPGRRYAPPVDREQYDSITDNPFIRVQDDPRSTFSIDVDTASYALVRRFLSQYQRPARGAVRIEEMVNYFRYDYAPPTGEHPFAVHAEVNAAPWTPAHRLVKIGLKGREIARDRRAASNLVFLIDVSGSMNEPNKLPLVKQSMQMLVDQLGGNDRVALVVYAGAAGLVLDSTPGQRKAEIGAAIERLSAGGSTAGGAGIQLAYKVARANFIEGGVNRVILCTDGDFNVGVTSRSELVDLIEKEAKSKVYLSILGFGRGNYQDASMEELSNKGNGNYAYIDTINEARKVLVEQMAGTLVTIAKDVKIQVEFNPAEVAAFRLIGYENRVLAHRDFNDDKKDAGDIGTGHTVTALYEVVPAGQEIDLPGVDPLKYQRPAAPANAVRTGEIMTVKLRYKQPEGDTSTLMTVPVIDEGRRLDQASGDFRFASAVALFGMLLRDSPHKGAGAFDDVLTLANQGRETDEGGYRAEFVELVRKAREVVK